MQAEIAGRAVRVGRPAWAGELHGQPLPESTHAVMVSGDTVVALADTTGWLALFRLGDGIRPDAASTVTALRAAGLKLALLTGDAWPVAERVARELGIDEVHAGATPQEKHAFVEALQRQGAVVAMIGDGVNDAPVLAQAQVSVAMGGGAQLARTQADLVLLCDRLHPVAGGYQLARRCLALIRQNLAWAFVYNFVALPLAMLGYVTPWMAGIGMSGSSLLVVLNALRLQSTSTSEG